MDKKILRREILAKREQLTPQQISIAGERLFNLVRTYDKFKENKVIYLYLSYQQEIPTRKLIEFAWKEEKTVAVPKVLDKEHMEFFKITSWEQVKSGYKGIPEPFGELELVDEPGLMFLPGLVFDHNRNRIGYGGGFYDRYLDDNESERYYKVGLCYDFQLVENIPAQAHDEKVNEVISVSTKS